MTSIRLKEEWRLPVTGLYSETDESSLLSFPILLKYILILLEEKL
jgi:hypothetical protein